MDRFVIEGPCRLSGRVRAEGAKNAALPALAATLLSDGEVTLSGLPEVRDIRTLRRLLEHLGVESAAQEDGGLRLAVTGDGSHDDAPYELVKTMRASVLVLGPLLARYGHARVSLPGGCAIGVRPIDQHLAGLEALGAEVDLEHGYVTARAPALRGARFRFAMPTVTGTENVLMAATLARGTTVLENCAREPEVEDLAALLSAMGARIDGAGTSTITVEGVERLGGAGHRVVGDRIEAGTYLIGAAISGGDVTVEGTHEQHLLALLERLAETGCEVDGADGAVRVRRAGELQARDVVTAPHPGFPTDLQAQYVALMTQATGTATVCESVFENRFQHVPELRRMGARIDIDGHYAKVAGPSPLAGAAVMATDLRASACLVLAGLVADGVTEVSRIYHLDRGYARMEEKLTGLGARVTRVV
ncbi:MAG: UDP-N-acetylglucosamine 1-carboxyvinyltransferase [Thermoanaerobaculia bacterium]